MQLFLGQQLGYTINNFILKIKNLLSNKIQMLIRVISVFKNFAKTDSNNSNIFVTTFQLYRMFPIN